jgi:RNA polymerase sigma-70 factor (ECF subfamily)
MDELPPEPLPWLYRAAHFGVANQRRTLARRGRLDDRARLQAASRIARDHSEIVAADMELAAAFRALSEADREVLRLPAWEGLSPEAIEQRQATALRISVSRLARGCCVAIPAGF